jgi:hypothetical protein
MPTNSKVALAAVILACGIGTAWWLYPATQAPATLSSQADLPDRQTRPEASTSPIAVSETAKATVSSRIREPAFDQSNLFSTFQLALASENLDAVEGGLQAWRACAGYVGHGTWDLEVWLNHVLPEGLPIQERDKRAKYGRASSQRCAGFAGQTQAVADAEGLSLRAREMGSTSEILRSAMFGLPPNVDSDKVLVAKLSCDVVQHYPTTTRGVRLISPAMREAAAIRPTHFLNATPQPARSIAINLAFCDLDPQGCNAHSDRLGSACIQSGKCTFEREEEYWRAMASPSDFVAANRLRETIVQHVKQRNCAELFK